MVKETPINEQPKVKPVNNKYATAFSARSKNTGISTSFDDFVSSYRLDGSDIYQINQSFINTIALTDFNKLFQILVQSALNIQEDQIKLIV